MDNPRVRRRVQPGVWTCAALAAVLSTACLTTRLGPGVLRQDWNQRARDPVPPPPGVAPRDPWSDEREERIAGPGEAQPDGEGEGEGDEPGHDEGDSTAVDLAKRSLATGLAVAAGGQGRMVRGLAGWLPILEATGTFEEDSTTRKLHQQRRARAERARAEQKKRRIERPGPDDQR